MKEDINLEKIGLTREEYVVYQALLINEPDTVVEIARLTGISRVSLYKVLQSLFLKKLITKRTKVGRSIYRALPPDHLLQYAQKIQSEVEKEVSNLKQKVPLLNSLSPETINKSEFVVYQGTSAVLDVNKVLLKSSEPLKGFVYNFEVSSCFDYDKNGILLDNDYLKAIKKCGGDYFVFPGNDQNILESRKVLYKNPFLGELWHPRWLPENQVKIEMNLFAFDDVIIFSELNANEKNIDSKAYVIRNQSIANTMKTISQFLYENANPIV